MGNSQLPIRNASSRNTLSKTIPSTESKVAKGSGKPGAKPAKTVNPKYKDLAASGESQGVILVAKVGRLEQRLKDTKYKETIQGQIDRAEELLAISEQQAHQQHIAGGAADYRHSQAVMKVQEDIQSCSRTLLQLKSSVSQVLIFAQSGLTKSGRMAENVHKQALGLLSKSESGFESLQSRLSATAQELNQLAAQVTSGGPGQQRPRHQS